MDQRKYKILINTRKEENHITRELVLEEEIMKTGHICPRLPSEILNTNEETTEKEIIIGGIPLKIQFKIYEGNHNITLGIKLLEKVKPYSIENEQLTITCQNKKNNYKKNQKWLMKIFILAKIIVEGYHNRYYTPMIDTGAEANICKYNCLPEDKWEKTKNTHGSNMI